MAEQNNRFSGMSRAELEREARKQIVHSGLLALAALIVIAVACYAWFCGAGAVTAQGMAVRLGSYGFDLASAGEITRLDESLPEEFATVPEGETLPGDYVPSGSTGKWSWTAGKQLVSWRMDKDANIGNLLGTEAEGIRPGTSGKMRFYVIPWDTGDLTIRFQLDTILMEGDGEKMTLRRDDTAQKLLRGHLLFAFSAGSQRVYYSGGGYTLDFTGAEQGKPIEVTVDWSWPKTWEDAKVYQFSGILTDWQKNHFDWLFYQQEPTTGTTFTDEQLGELYDAADQYIGGDQQKANYKMYAIGLRLTGDKLS